MSLNKSAAKQRIAIIGGGPSGLFMCKKLVASDNKSITIDVFERRNQLGAGLPYSFEGANAEHITNVSGNEIPDLVTSLEAWMQTQHEAKLEAFNISKDHFNEYKVLPRLLFGEYLEDQFKLLLQTAAAAGIGINVYKNSPVTDVEDLPDKNIVEVIVDHQHRHAYDVVVICTGHKFPVKHEGQIPGYFDSPYPPEKLALKVNYPVAIKGTSLTAIDAIRTLVRKNGMFSRSSDEKLNYQVAAQSEGFKLVLHSRKGMLPAVRFHLEDSHLKGEHLISHVQIKAIRADHNGFVPLDLVFEHNFKALFMQKDPDFYAKIKDLNMEEFVAQMMELRENLDPFQLLKAEYIQAEKSIARKKSVYWKEALAILSASMNKPAKYFSAEDMQRMQKVLMPLIAIVIAFVPQSSVEELIALYDAGVLELIADGEEGYEEPGKTEGADYLYKNADGKEQSVHYRLFVNCIGQPHLSYADFPYKSLLNKRTLSPAMVKFKDQRKGSEAFERGDEGVIKDPAGNYVLGVPGVKINDDYQVVDAYDAQNDRIYIMAVPYIGGFNPDYSGLDFCDAASEVIAKRIAG